MKIKIIGLLAFLILLGLSPLFLRKQAKTALPRSGEIEMVGGVYTPYLLLDSTLYFLKGWDESLDFAFSKSFTEKSKFELIFANKRLLEMEKLTREGNYTFTPRLVDSFSRSLGRAIDFTNEALKRDEDVEELIWLFQESAQDQQGIFKKISAELPEDKRIDVLAAQKQSAEEIGSFLKESYKLNQKEF